MLLAHKRTENSCKYVFGGNISSRNSKFIGKINVFTIWIMLTLDQGLRVNLSMHPHFVSVLHSASLFSEVTLEDNKVRILLKGNYIVGP